MTLKAHAPKLRVLVSHTHNPWFNIATEDWIFREMDPTVQTLYLWRNSETVVIGRNQNPWSECNLAKMEEDGVALARRTSGGGAVYHDLGNTNFTFLSPREGYDRSLNSAIVTRALGRFGINAEVSGRNDIVIASSDGPRKVSGSAFRETRDRAFHHGTLLINADLECLSNYLTPHPKKLQSKGRASVRARVMNLAEANSNINHDDVSHALIEEFFATYGARTEIEIVDPQSAAVPGLAETFERFASWDWRFGHAPQFQQQLVEYLAWGFIEIHVDCKAGAIERAQVFSDALFPDFIDSIQTSLSGKAFSRAGMELAAKELVVNHPSLVNEIEELKRWLFTQVEIA